MYLKEKTAYDLIQECISILREKPEEYIYEISHSHDKLFREVLSNVEDFKDFIAVFVDYTLGKIIKNEILEPYNKSFIKLDYSGLESDIIFKIKDKPIYLLVEHQSSVDSNMPYRIFEYTTELIKEDMRIRHSNIYPKVIPIVLYTGDSEWKVNRSYKENEFKIDKYYNNFVDVSYLLVDINDYSIDDLIKTRTMIAYAMTLEKSKTKAMLLDTLAEIGRKLKVQDKTHLEKIIRYLFNPALEEEAIEKLIASFESKGVDEVKNVLEVIMDQEKLKGKKEGKREGKKEGIKEGIKEAKRQFITNMLLQGLSVSTIEKYTGISQKEIEEIQKKGGEVC